MNQGSLDDLDLKRLGKREFGSGRRLLRRMKIQRLRNIMEKLAKMQAEKEKLEEEVQNENENWLDDGINLLDKRSAEGMRFDSP